jgi:glycosyltransferase involved in cell wall biosynthesis
MEVSDAAAQPVSIVVPCRNEAAGVVSMIEELMSQLDERPSVDWEVIVVDDGSTDGTSEAVAPFEGERFTIVRHERAQGYGAALKSGIRRARHAWVLIIDADGTYPPCHVPEILAERTTHEMVVGARIGVERHIPWIRRPAKWALRRFASLLSGAEIVDLNSGLRVFRKDLSDRFLPLLPNGFSFTSTITLAALSSNLPICYVPIDYRRRTGSSKLRPVRDTMNFLTLLIRTVMFFDPLRILLPVALLFMTASVVVAVGSLLLTDRLMDVTTVVLLVAGVQILALGAIADVINRWLH